MRRSSPLLIKANVDNTVTLMRFKDCGVLLERMSVLHKIACELHKMYCNDNEQLWMYHFNAISLDQNVGIFYPSPVQISNPLRR